MKMKNMMNKPMMVTDLARQRQRDYSSLAARETVWPGSPWRAFRGLLRIRA